MYASVPALNRTGTLHSTRSTVRRYPPGAMHLSLARGRAAAAHASLDYILTPVVAAPRSRRNSGSGAAAAGIQTFSRTLSLPPQQRQPPPKTGPWWLPARLRASKKTLGSGLEKVSSRARRKGSRPAGQPPTPSPDYGDVWWQPAPTTSTNTRPGTSASRRSERDALPPPPPGERTLKGRRCRTERARSRRPRPRPLPQHDPCSVARDNKVSTARRMCGHVDTEARGGTRGACGGSRGSCGM